MVKSGVGSYYRRVARNAAQVIAGARALYKSPIGQMYGRSTGAVKVWKPQRWPAKRPRTESVTVPRKRVRYGKTQVQRTWTRGYPGRRFKTKMRRSKLSVMQKYGVRFDFEKGGLATGTDLVVVGHAFGPYNVFLIGMMAILRTLFRRGGRDITAADEPVVAIDHATTTITAAKIRLFYNYDKDNSNTDFVEHDITSVDTLLSVAIAFQTLVGAKIAGTNGTQFYLYHIDLVYRDVVGSAAVTPVVSVPLMDSFLYFSCFSSMKLQNRTLASTSGTSDESNLLDVANNPIAGKRYMGRGNGPRLAHNGSSAASPNASANFLGDFDYGEIVPDLTQVSPALTRPPSKARFGNCNSAVNVMLKPGQIRPSTLYVKKRMLVNSWIKLVMLSMGSFSADSTNRNTWSSFGNYSVFGFEKVCNTGSDEPAINVGYEINTMYSAKLDVQSVGFATTFRIA